MGRIQSFFICLTVLAVSAELSYAQCTNGWKPSGVPFGFLGNVFATVSWQPEGQPPQLIAGGDFTSVDGQPINHIASWDGTTWNSLASGIDPTGNVQALAIYNGKLIAGGSFTDASGSGAHFLAEWDGTAWHSIPGASETITALAVYDGKLIAAGGVPNKIARWDGATWQSLGTGTNDTIVAFTIYNGMLIAGGSFTTAGGIAANRIAQWDGVSWASLGSGLNGSVVSLVSYGSAVVASGQFTSAGGLPALCVAQWNGSRWSGFASTGPSSNHELAVYNGELFSISDGAYRSLYLTRWNGINWQNVGSLGSYARGYATTVYQGQLVVAGHFASAGGVRAQSIAQWNGSSWSGVGTGFGGPGTYSVPVTPKIYTISDFNGSQVVGGLFEFAGGCIGNNVAKWNGADYEPFDNGFNNCVNALSVYGGKVIAGGAFNLSGSCMEKIASFNNTYDYWQNLGCQCNGDIHAMMNYNGDLIAGGVFTLIGGVSTRGIARWDGTAWHAMGSGLSSVYALTIFNGNLIAGGNSVFQWNGTTWQELGFGPGGYVSSLTVFNGNLIAGGSFGFVGNIAWWDGTNWQPFGSGASSSVEALTVYKGKLIAGGWFESIGGTSAPGIAEWDGNAWSNLGSGVAGGAVFALAVRDGDLFVGGSFVTAGDISSPTLARWGPMGPIPLIVQQPVSPLVCQNSAVSMHADATGSGTLTYQWQKAGQDLTDTAEVYGTQTDTLIFTHAQPTDTGPYACVVKLNDCTQTTSNAATLAVYAAGSADGNADCLTNARDIQPFIDALINFAPVSATLCAYDLTGEGIVNLEDVAPFVARLLD